MTPKSLGGDNSADNIVRLTIREHYVAHLLLTKMFEGREKQKMFFAFKCMTNGFGRQERYKPSSRGFELRRNILHIETSLPPKPKVEIPPEVRRLNKVRGIAKTKQTLAKRTPEQIRQHRINAKLGVLRKSRDSLSASINALANTMPEFIYYGNGKLTPEMVNDLASEYQSAMDRRLNTLQTLNEQIRNYEIANV